MINVTVPPPGPHHQNQSTAMTGRDSTLETSALGRSWRRRDMSWCSKPPTSTQNTDPQWTTSKQTGTLHGVPGALLQCNIWLWVMFLERYRSSTYSRVHRKLCSFANTSRSFANCSRNLWRFMKCLWIFRKCSWRFVKCLWTFRKCSWRFVKTSQSFLCTLLYNACFTFSFKSGHAILKLWALKDII